MTTTAPTQSTTEDAVAVAREAFAAVHTAADHALAAVAALGSTDLPLDVATLEWLVQEAQRVVNRHDRIRIRALDVVRRTREAGGSHHDNDAQFTAGRTHTDPRGAARDTHLAKALGNQPPTPPPNGPQGAPPAGPEGAGELDGAGAPGDHDGGGAPGDAPGTGAAGAGGGLSPTAAAWDAGLITREHALIITSALDDLPDHLTDGQRLTVEEGLVAKAEQVNPATLRKAAKRALEALDLPEGEVDAHHDQLLHNQERAAWDAASFWMRDNHDGTWFGQFTLPELQAHMLKKALEALTNPRRRKGNAAPTGATGDSRFDRAVRDQQRGQALAELIDHLPTDQLGTKINATVLIRTDLATLRGETDRAGITDTGTEISTSELRRLASNAGLIPIVMNGTTIPIDLGRQRRFFTDSQRAALALLYDTCAAGDCDRPFAWCEIHHAQPWKPVHGPDGQLLHPGGGRTDLANAIPLCGKHHRQLTDHRLTHTIHRDHHGKATITYTWRKPGDPWNTSDPPTPDTHT
ncbi:HNH endonuclease signature motif containing protein [Kytococcus sedentarius]|uniref:HNH endonuclease signature motif containing protein n=1 Tax=Kytococcus sedentarius TaxID=1276 RepID=UPI00195257A2|nr:HNH endonuclease signature motif containing protein [Kytococcus sedentarius]QRO87226.1 DUF222 domain-containing protein [Kytococcus sedentarius]